MKKLRQDESNCSNLTVLTEIKRTTSATARGCSAAQNKTLDTKHFVLSLLNFSRFMCRAIFGVKRAAKTEPTGALNDHLTFFTPRKKGTRKESPITKCDSDKKARKGCGFKAAACPLSVRTHGAKTANRQLRTGRRKKLRFSLWSNCPAR